MCKDCTKRKCFIMLVLVFINFSSIFIYSQVIIRDRNTNKDDSIEVMNLLLGKWVTIDYDIGVELYDTGIELIRDEKGELWYITFWRKRNSNRYYIHSIDKIKIEFRNKDSLRYFYYMDDKDTGYFFDDKNYDFSAFIVSWKYISKVRYRKNAKLHYFIYDCASEEFYNRLGPDVFLCAVSKNDLLLVSARGRYLTYVRPKKRMKFIYDKWYKW
jgi:hypothetical protein